MSSITFDGVLYVSHHSQLVLRRQFVCNVVVFVRSVSAFAVGENARLAYLAVWSSNRRVLEGVGTSFDVAKLGPWCTRKCKRASIRGDMVL